MKPFVRKSIALLLAAAAFMAMLAGCSSNSGPQSSAGAGGDSADPINILRVCNTNTPDIDPATGSDGASGQALINLYDPLVSEDEAGNLIPFLAEDWTVSDDGLTWVFTLRENVKFHDGDILNADDVVYSMNRWLEMGTGEAYLFAAVASVEATGELEVTFRLSNTFGAFLTALTKFYIVNKDLLQANQAEGDYGENGDYGVAYLQTNDAGCGAYMVSEIATNESLTAVKFDDYWAGWGESPIETIRFIGSDESETVRTMMANGMLEQTDEYQSIETNNMLATIEGVELVQKPTTSQDVIMLNTQKAPLDDVHVRRALAYLMDYETAVESIYPGTTKAKGCVPATMAGFNDNATEYTMDLEAARNELAQSAYADTIGSMPIEISWCSGVDAQEQLALLFQSCAAQLGIVVEIEEYGWNTLCDAVTAPETTPHAVVMEIGNAYNDMGSELQTTFSSTNSGVWSNTTWLNDPELDAAIAEALATTDTEERYAKYGEIQATIMDLCPCIWICDTVATFAYNAAKIEWPIGERIQNGEEFSKLKGFYYHDYSFIG